MRCDDGAVRTMTLGEAAKASGVHAGTLLAVLRRALIESADLIEGRPNRVRVLDMGAFKTEARSWVPGKAP